MVLVSSCGIQPSNEEADNSTDTITVSSSKPAALELEIDTIFELDLSGQGLTEVPDLSGYPYLKRLDLSNNKIQLRDYEEFKRLVHDDINNYHYGSMELEYLDLSHNQIGHMDYPFKTSSFPSLKYLDLSHNKIKRFWPYGYNLTKLDLSHNELDSIFILDFEIDTLDLSYNTKLRGQQSVQESLIRHIQLDGVNEKRIEFVHGPVLTIATICVDFPYEPSEEEVDTSRFEFHLRKNLEESLNLKDPFIKYPISLLYDMVYDENGSHSDISIGRIIESPDKRFKIYQLEGSYTGAYTNEFWKSYLYTDRKYYFRELELTEIDTVYVLPDNKYLIVHEHGIRVASVYGESRKYADLISITRREVQVNPIHTPSYPWHYEEKDRERLELVCGGDSESHLLNIDYNSNNQTLNYEFSNNLLWCCDANDSTYTFSGTYKYIDGEFVHQIENRVGRKGKHE